VPPLPVSLGGSEAAHAANASAAKQEVRRTQVDPVERRGGHTVIPNSRASTC
jgi:hypothetical protein